MKQWMMIGLIALLSTGAVQAQTRHELTVKEAVDLAYKNVIELQNAQIDYRIQEAKNKEILGQALPQLSGNVGANHYLKLPFILFPDATSTAIYSILKQEGVQGSSGPITNVPPVVQRQVAFQQPWNFQASATLNQLLFQPDVFVGLQARKTALQYSNALIEQTRERIKDSAYKRYYAILIAERQLGFINAGLERLQKLYQDDSVMFKNGFAERLDLDKVQVQINNLISTKAQIESGIEIGYAALKFSLGLPQQDTVVLKEDLSSVNLKDGILATDFQYENRAEVRTLNVLRDLQQLDLKRNRLGYLPTVAASANYTLSGLSERFFNKNTAWINSAFVGLNINIPIFDGFQRKYKVQQSRLNIEKLDNSIKLAKQGIDLEQNINRNTLKTALFNLDVQERNMQLAEKVFNTTKLKFQQGLGSSFEVLQADADYQTAQSNYFNALYNAAVAKTSYLYSLGKL